MATQETFELVPGLNSLPRGGFLVPTSAGYIQFGAPPETIKDTMRLPGKVPHIFVLPVELFHVEKGIAVAELEFPVYFNHFLLKQKTLIIGTKEQTEALEIVLNESVFGPSTLNLESEFIDGANAPYYPDLLAEMNYFRGNRDLKDLVEFCILDQHQTFKIDNVVIHLIPHKGYEVIDNDTCIAMVPLNMAYQIKYDIGKKLDHLFEAPDFGITCLGSSHGFDPEDNTSGFILWINRRGIMIDPPVNSTEWLRDSNVNPRTISHIILTHCHADHDAGTFQKILEEVSVYIHTTETIMDSFLRKYGALTGLSHKELCELFIFCPILIDTPMYIEGAEFFFHYSLHSIPALGFRCFYRDQSFLYTSDHLNHPESLEQINKAGVLTKGRYEFLKNFPWHLQTIYHESGIPPLHTPISYLSSLDEDIQKRITVYHIAQKDFPKDTKLTLAKFGIENTHYPPIAELQHVKAVELLDILSHVDLFDNFPIYKSREFLVITETKEYKKGEIIIKKGEKGEHFYIIITGTISVQDNSKEHDTNKYFKTYDKYEYFGEVSLVTNQPRTADVIAETDIKVLTIKRDLFLNFIQGTEVELNLKNLSNTRNECSWHVLSNSQVFGGLTSHQRTQLETIMQYQKIKKNTKLFSEGSIVDNCYIIINGNIEVRKKEIVKNLHMIGDFIGDIFSLQKNKPSSFSAKVVEDTEIYIINRVKLSKFIQKNPGVYMRLLRTYNNLFEF